MGDAKFRRHPRPDDDVVRALERALAAAKKGYVRSIVIVAVNPVNTVDTSCEGDLGPIKKNAVLGGIFRLALELTKQV